MLKLVRFELVCKMLCIHTKVSTSKMFPSTRPYQQGIPFQHVLELHMGLQQNVRETILFALFKEFDSLKKYVCYDKIEKYYKSVETFLSKTKRPWDTHFGM